MVRTVARGLDTVNVHDVTNKSPKNDLSSFLEVERRAGVDRSTLVDLPRHTYGLQKIYLLSKSYLTVQINATKK